MIDKYISILKKIEDNGFIAYIVGGYVRDYLLGNINSLDIDIITNATVKDLDKIFDNTNREIDSYGAVKLMIEDHAIDITTFRREYNYKNGNPTRIEYTNSLEEDLKRRDFTINTFVMDKDKNIIDLLDAKIDLDNKVIKTIRDVKEELTEDESRIIRALRFMSSLDFELDKELKAFIINNKYLIKNVNLDKRKRELDKLFKTRKATKFMKFIKDESLEEYIGFKVEKYIETTTLIGGYAQLDFIDDYNFTKYEKEQIKGVKSLINKGSIDKIDLYKYGSFISSVAAEILGISKKDITKEYFSLPIKSRNEINISSLDICDIINIKPSKKLGEIISYIEKDILLGKLNNNKEDIIIYLKENYDE